jgi:hypothetical protein
MAAMLLAKDYPAAHNLTANPERAEPKTAPKTRLEKLHYRNFSQLHKEQKAKPTPYEQARIEAENHQYAFPIVKTETFQRQVLKGQFLITSG